MTDPSPGAQYRTALVHTLKQRMDPAGCTQRQGADPRDCYMFWSLRPDKWCLTCLLKALVEELENG